LTNFIEQNLKHLLLTGGAEVDEESGKEVFHSTAMTLKLEEGRPIVAFNLKFLKHARAGAVTVFYGGNEIEKSSYIVLHIKGLSNLKHLKVFWYCSEDPNNYCLFYNYALD
jgi:hypothetical protein